jgi:dihydroorotase
MTNLTLPGLVDVHVHLREPGGTHKEDVTSGTTAALSGGVVGVLDMPNNAPPITDRHTFYRKLSIFRAKAVSDYGLFVGFDGAHVEAMVAAAPEAVGLKLYLDETFGDLTTREPARLAEVFEAWPGPGPIAVHAESPSILVALRLAERYGQRLHVCHVPHPDDLLRIDAARQRGVAVTCEVTPHHLFLSDEAVTRLGPYARMKPPLLAPDLVARFWERLDLVDAIASDHAPHTREEKGALPYHQATKDTREDQGEGSDGAGRTGRTRGSAPTPARPTPSPRTRGEGWGEGAPPGVPGLETTLPLLLRAVDEGRLTLERMLELVHHNPLGIYGLRAPADTAVEVELGERYRLPFEGYRTRCGWSPFAGQWALGRVARVRLRGTTVYEDGRVLVEPGYGAPLERT